MKEIILNISDELKANQFIIPQSINAEFKDGKLVVSYEIGNKFPDEVFDSMIVGEIYKMTFHARPNCPEGNVWFFRFNGKQGNIINSQNYIVPDASQKHISYSNFRPTCLVDVSHVNIQSIEPASESERKAYNFLEHKYAEKFKSYKYSAEIYEENWKLLVDIFQEMVK